jgi:hypothetical protein
MTEPAPEELAPAPADVSARRDYRVLVGVLAALLLVLVTGVATAPFWAPPVSAVLPWGAAARKPDPELLQRVGSLEASYEQQHQEAARNASAMNQLGRRLTALETKEGEQRQAAEKTAAAVQDLGSRIATLQRTEEQDQQGVADTASSLKQLGARLAKLESQPEASAQDLAALRQQFDKLSAAQATLSSRIETVEKSMRAQAPDPTDAGLLVALLQIREAIEAGRPFAAEYDAIARLARDRTDIAKAAAPLGDAAKSGVASRSVLAKRLHELAGSIANARSPSGEADWGSAALGRLRGLVTVHRIGGAGQSGPEAAVSAAEAGLASGDLAGAIAALDQLSGAPAEAAQPWLRMAHQRLAAEEALKRIQTLLVARLDRSAEPAATPAPPG